MVQSLAAEFSVAVTDGAVWLAIGQGLLFGGTTLLLGTWVSRRVGLLAPGSPAGEVLGVGLASGLMVLAAIWAAIWSGGRSSFTPVAMGFAITIAVALARGTRHRAPSLPSPGKASATESCGVTSWVRWPWSRSAILTTVAGGVWIIAIALLHGSTLAPSSRDGVQPIENNDEAYYAILGRDLADTGTETMYSTSGFTELGDLPSQNWYHWGELWLASFVIKIFGTGPLAARYVVVLPVVLLAAAAMTGTVVRRTVGTSSRQAYLFGFLACLFLAPVPVIAGPFFSSRTVGLVFGNAGYGLVAVAVLVTLYLLSKFGTRTPTWALAGLAGSVIAFILPAHLVVAALALVGVASAWVLRTGRSIVSFRRLPAASPAWRRPLIVTVVLLIATVAWGSLTGHGIGSSGGTSQTVAPFNETWRGSVAIAILGAGVIFAIPVAWLADRGKVQSRADLYLGTMMLLVVGAALWGARVGDFNMFHMFYGGILVFATPVAAIAVWTLWVHLRQTKRVAVAAGLVVLTAIQVELNVLTGAAFLATLAPLDYRPIPNSVLTAIGQLPAGAKVAYACGQFEEVGFAGSMLLSIDAHTGRRVVPMCFQADNTSALIGGAVSVQVANAFFKWAPQRAVFPNAAAYPSSAAVATFMREHGIDYIYIDEKHPNSLVADAVAVVVDGDVAVLRVP